MNKQEPTKPSPGRTFLDRVAQMPRKLKPPVADAQSESDLKSRLAESESAGRKTGSSGSPPKVETEFKTPLVSAEPTTEKDSQPQAQDVRSGSVITATLAPPDRERQNTEACGTAETPAVPVRVGLIGPTNVGKTTYFAVLRRALEALDWQVRTENDKNFLLDEISDYMTRGYWPPKTKDQTPTQGLYFRISKGASRFFELNCFDPPGEIFEQPGSHESDKEPRETVYASMQQSRGILILLSLEKTANELRDIWSRSVGSFINYAINSGNRDLVNEQEQLRIRTAIVFTKADHIPWMDRHRSRDAAAWLDGSDGLRDLKGDIERHSTTDNLKFFFSSAVGWNEGQTNVRTVIQPRDLELLLREHGSGSNQASGVQLYGDLIPDPPEGDGRRSESLRPNAKRPQSTTPLFKDPTRFADHKIDEVLAQSLCGVVTLPGRYEPRSQQAKNKRLFTPWNIVEPLLWAAGFSAP